MWEPILSQNFVRPIGYLTEPNPPLSAICHVYFDSIYSLALYSNGVGTENELGPMGAVTVKLEGSKFPTKLHSVDTDIATLVSTSTDHDMGLSNPSVSISCAAGHEIRLTFKRRF